MKLLRSLVEKRGIAKDDELLPRTPETAVDFERASKSMLAGEREHLDQGAGTVDQLWQRVAAYQTTRRTFPGLMALTAGLIELTGCATTAVMETSKIKPIEYKKEKANEREELLHRMELYRKEIALYKGLGYEVQVAGMFARDSTRDFWTGKIASLAFRFKAAFSEINVRSCRDPLDQVIDQGAIKKEIAPELQDSSSPGYRTMQFPEYELAFHYDKQSRELHFDVRQWLNLRQPILFETTIENFQDIEEIDSEELQVQEAKINETISTVIQKLRQELSRSPIERYEEISPDVEAARHHVYTFDIVRDKELKPEQKESLIELAKKYDIKFSAVPIGGEVDRVPPPFRITEEIATDLAHPVIVHGEITDIDIIERRMRSAVVKGGLEGTVDNKKAFEKGYDDYGNFVVHSYLVAYHPDPHEKKREVGERFMVYPPRALGQKTDQPKATDFKLTGDVAAVIEGVVYQEIQHPVQSITAGERAYDVYSNLDHGTAQKEFGKFFAPIADGAYAAERLLGKEDGKSVQKIYIANSKHPNAFFHPKDPDTIVVQDEWLRRRPGTHNAFAAGFHEAEHLLDMQFNISDHEAVKVAYNQIKAQTRQDRERDKKSFFDFINESFFLEALDSDGGHSADNEKEFFATLMNTLNNPHWQSMFKGEGARWTNTYRDALCAVRTALLAITDISSQAPIFTLLEERINFFHAD